MPNSPIAIRLRHSPASPPNVTAGATSIRFPLAKILCNGRFVCPKLVPARSPSAGPISQTPSASASRERRSVRQTAISSAARSAGCSADEDFSEFWAYLGISPKTPEKEVERVMAKRYGHWGRFAYLAYKFEPRVCERELRGLLKRKGFAMYRIGSTVLSLLVLAGAPQASRQRRQPAPSNVPGRRVPKIHDNLRVTFRLKAPDARKVQLAPRGDDNGLGRGPFEMERDTAGTWTVTTPPVRSGFHYYELVVDGFHINDPASETFFGWGQQTSGLEVPDAKLDFYACKDVPHGEVRALWYHSKVTAQPRRAFVYTPPDYDRQPQRHYAVLYCNTVRARASGPGRCKAASISSSTT